LNKVKLYNIVHIIVFILFNLKYIFSLSCFSVCQDLKLFKGVVGIGKYIILNMI